VVAYGLGQLDGMGTSWEVWGWSWLDIGLNPTAPFYVLYFVFVCLFVLLHFQYLSLRFVFCMMATLQIACAEWKLPTGSQWTFRCIKIVCRRNAYLGVEILCFSNEIYILASK